jgi:hypothetical protein
MANLAKNRARKHSKCLMDVKDVDCPQKTVASRAGTAARVAGARRDFFMILVEPPNPR